MEVQAAIDVGGTFTDVVAIEDGQVVFGKVTTTSDAPELGALEALARVRLSPHSVDTLVHGSTIVLNAILERRGVRTALITTHGFRDVLEIMRTNRRSMYDLQQEKPVPLVRRHLRMEVRERVAADGSVLAPLVEEDVVAAAEVARTAGVEAIAVCLLNSYSNGEHERRVRDLLESALPGVPVTLSSDLSREWREFERTSTAVANAYVQPLVRRYTDGLTEHFPNTVLVMRSNGGVGTLADVRAEPVSTLMSGPVGGVIAAQAVAARAGIGQALTLDIGGTSADMCLIADGRVDVVAQREVDGFSVLIATVDVHSIGAGGGSVAWIDRGGALRVGPRSAGARPGPACYGRGGEEPTVTDAHVVLGRIDPASFLGGDMPLELDAARRAVGKLATPLRVTLEHAAVGTIRVADLRMVEEVRRLATRAGFDLRDFTLIPFGGAGPLHGTELCRELGIPRMIVPIGPGTLSALGLLMADLRRDFSETRPLPVNEAAADELQALFDGLDRRAKASGHNDVLLVHTADLRYASQEFTINTDAPGHVADGGIKRLRSAFEEAHERLYGYRLDAEIVLVTARVSAIVRRPPPRLAAAPPPGSSAAKGVRRVFDLTRRAWEEYQVIDRTLLRPGDAFHGPAIVDEPQSTTALASVDRLVVDTDGNLVVSIGTVA